MQRTKLPRRQILKLVTAMGISSTVFARALEALAQERSKVTEEMIKQAEWIAGLELDDEKRKMMVKGIGESLASYEKIRKVAIDNSVPPALAFRPIAGPPGARPRHMSRWMPASLPRPASEDDIAFAPVTHLAAWLRTRQISSVELTKLYLARLKKFNPLLECVVTFTEGLAMKQAEQADRELAAGRWRGPLHGVPWGAKDLLAVPGYPTTWGAPPYKDQVRPEKATVVERLESAGAVLVAKTAVGSLAWGDVWFGGVTKNPWNPKQGSSGSSAGSASATAAGLVGFAIGTETLGSIVSPCTRCGATGLRPTFGRVSRYGAMALAWSMDKIGSIARSVEDCALVFNAIHGNDPKDPSVADGAFVWPPPQRDVMSLRVGYVPQLFEEDRSREVKDEVQKKLVQETQGHERKALEVLKGLGIKLIPIKLPDTYPVADLGFILDAEAAACFDELTRSGKDALLVRQKEDSWPNTFRQGQLIPAVEYIRANRIRTLVMQEMEKLMAEVDVYVTPAFGSVNLLLTNLTGHPQVVLPNGFRSNGTPSSITFTGKLYGETELLAVARAYQHATDFHARRPKLEALPKKD